MDLVTVRLLIQIVITYISVLFVCFYTVLGSYGKDNRYDILRWCCRQNWSGLFIDWKCLNTVTLRSWFQRAAPQSPWSKPPHCLGHDSPLWVPLRNNFEVRCCTRRLARCHSSCLLTRYDPLHMKLFQVWPTNYKEQSPSWDANISSDSQEISGIWWNPKVHCRILKSPPPVPTMKHSHAAQFSHYNVKYYISLK
jgi:hypothetical protein